MTTDELLDHISSLHLILGTWHAYTLPATPQSAPRGQGKGKTARAAMLDAMANTPPWPEPLLTPIDPFNDLGF